MINYKYLLFIFVLVILISQRIAQKGSRAKKPKKSPSHSMHKNNTSKTSKTIYQHTENDIHIGQQNCININGTIKCEQSQQQSQKQTAFLIILSSLLVLVCAGGILSYIKTKINKKKKIQQIMNEFEQMSKQNPCKLNLNNRQKMIDQIMQGKYSIITNANDESSKKQCNIKITDLVKITDQKYSIKIHGQQIEYGTSKFQGLLIFRSDGLGLKIIKNYDDRIKAGQVNKFQTLIYQGFGRPDKLTGTWQYKGHERSPEFSGRWKLVKK